MRRSDTIALAALPPLALYIHVPWCLRKCPYCDFNSHEFAGELPQQRYIDALLADLDAALPQVWGRRVVSVFIGGSTPSLLEPAAVERLLGAVRARLPLEPGCEVTLEANPGSFERERFRGFRDAGVTRLSVGVQSFDDAMLAALGRVHDARQARAALDEARAAFETFNIDLMYALPGQDEAALAADLEAALSYRPPHLSIYHLTIEPNTRFALQPPKSLPDDDSAARMLDLIVERTGAAGLQRYEVSAFARSGHRCSHNLNYWRVGDYLGIGAGAHGKLSFADRIVRQVRWREPATYIQQALSGAAVSNEQVVTAAELPFEYMLNALRLKDGFSLQQFSERTGLRSDVLGTALAQAQAKGLVDIDGLQVRASARGFDFLSDLQALFLN